MNVHVHIRWMIRRDMATVLDIESASFKYPWPEEEFVRVLRKRNCIGMVAEHDDRVVGYFIKELHKDRYELLSIAVDPSCRRCGVGASLMNKLKGKLHGQRTHIKTIVSDENLEAQLFLRSQGWVAKSVSSAFYDNGSDAYLMEYRQVPQNRISQHLLQDMEIDE